MNRHWAAWRCGTRIAILALFLFAGSTSFGQSGPFGPLNPKQSGLPSPWTGQRRDFGKITSQRWEGQGALHSWAVLLAPPKQAVAQLGDAQIDPKIIVHPSQSRIGNQPSGKQIAQNQFPGLELRPIQWPNLKIEPIPIVWPNLKLQLIPTICAACTKVPPGMGSATDVTSSAK